MAGRIAYYGGIVTNGLVLDLDAAKKDSYPGTGTSWLDISGNSNNGTLTNGPTFNSNNGGAIVFDGVDDYVNCGTSNITPNSYTVGCFVQISRLTGTNTFVAKTETINQYSQNFALGYAQSLGNKFYIGAKLTNGSYFYSCVSSFTPSINTIYNVYATYNSTTFTYKLYINGILDNTQIASFGNVIFPTQMIQIGASDATAANLLQGSIYTTQIYNRELSSTEILQNYNALKGRYGL